MGKDRRNGGKMTWKGVKKDKVVENTELLVDSDRPRRRSKIGGKRRNKRIIAASGLS
jgi:hypothetical protein